MCAFSHFSALPLFAQDVLAAGPEGLGTLNASLSAGGALAVMLLSLLPERVPRQPLLGAIFLVYGLSIMAWAGAESLVAAAAVFTVMATWKTGKRLVGERLREGDIPLRAFVDSLEAHPPRRVPGTAVYLYRRPFSAPPILITNLRLHGVLHEQVILLGVEVEDVPRVHPRKALEVHHLGRGITQAILHVGYLFVGLGFLLAGLAELSHGRIAASAGIHAWTAGAIGTMTLAVMTRASLGHTGRALTAGPMTAVIYAGVVLAAVLRIASAFAPELTLVLIPAAGVAWIVAFLGFAAAYGPMLVRPRAGRPT